MVQEFLLISDGSSDAALIPIIKSALKEKFPNIDFKGERAEFYRVPNPPKTLREKIVLGIDLYQPDMIFIHRDCEKFGLQTRHEEVDTVIKELDLNKLLKVIPLRMTEAWLLINEAAIRQAANNPHGRVRLNIPRLNRLESLPNPKDVLESLLKTASELKGRRLDNLNTRQAILRVADHITNWSSLNSLEAYQLFVNGLNTLLL